MKMKTYLVKLKPLEPYFFGSEKGFKNYSENGGFTSEDDITYFLQSRRFPQQTTLLGMLRKEILIQTNKLRADRKYSDSMIKEMEERIGKASFSIASPEPQTYGWIQALSPVLLYQKKAGQEGFFITVPKDHKVSKEDQKQSQFYQPMELADRSEVPLKTNFDYFVPFKIEKKADGKMEKEYDPKNGLASGLMNLQTKEIIDYNQAFVPFEKVGNNLKLENDGYYKQVYYTLSQEESFEFAFFLQSKFDFHDSIVYLGKNKSAFRITFEERKQGFEELVTAAADEKLKVGAKIVLLSDCYLPEEVENVFALRGSVSFRNLRNLKMNRIGCKYNFWERGSVIYVKSEAAKEAVLQLIQEQENLHRIGYNYAI